jgi:hypothetical protein
MLPIAEVLRPAQAWARGFQEHKNYDSGAIAPTLANNARMGHPRFFRGDIKKNRNGGPPADTESGLD